MTTDAEQKYEQSKARLLRILDKGTAVQLFKVDGSSNDGFYIHKDGWLFYAGQNQQNWDGNSNPDGIHKAYRAFKPEISREDALKTANQCDEQSIL